MYLRQHLNCYLPKESNDEDLTLDILSIFGMLLYFNYSRPMISRITGSEYDTAFTEKLIDHIVRFSIEGLGVMGK